MENVNMKRDLRKRQLPYVSVLAGLLLLAPAAWALPIPGQAWFNRGFPDPESITEERLRNVDPRCLEMMRTLATATIVLATTSVEVESGNRNVQYMSEEEHERWRASREEAGPAFGQVELTDNPYSPYVIRTETSVVQRRRMTSTTSLQAARYIQAQDGEKTVVFQRAWGGMQTWRSSSDEAPTAYLAPAWFPSSGVLLGISWGDIEVLAQSIAALIDAGNPSVIQERSSTCDGCLDMRWTRSAEEELRITVDPRHGYAPVVWRNVRPWDPNADFLAIADRFKADGEDELWEMDVSEELSSMLAEMPSMQEAQTFHFLAWERRVGGNWILGGIERRTETTYDDPEWAEVARERREHDPSTNVEWIAWKRIAAAAEDGLAFTSPPGYEGYTGQQWIDVVLPADARDRGNLITAFRDGIVLAEGKGVLGERRWVVAETDIARLGEWPLQPGDVLLETASLGGENPTPLTPADAPTPQHVTDRMARLTEGARSDAPTIVRLARGTTIVDIMCWVPKSDSADDRLALQQRILRSYEYPPLPYEDAVAFAEAVLAATNDLVRGTGE